MKSLFYRMRNFLGRMRYNRARQGVLIKRFFPKIASGTDVGRYILNSLISIGYESVRVSVVGLKHGQRLPHRQTRSGMYRLAVGDAVGFSISTPKNGYLSIFGLSTDGVVHKLFPVSGERNKVEARTDYFFPGELLPEASIGGGWRVVPPKSYTTGNPVRVVAIVFDDDVTLDAESLAKLGQSPDRGLPAVEDVVDEVYLLKNPAKWVFGYATCWIE